MEWHIVDSGAAAGITFLALIFELRRERRKKTAEIKADLQAAIGQLSQRIDKIERQDIEKLHERISETRSYERTVIAKVSEFEGQIKALTNIMQVVYSALLNKEPQQ